MGVVKIFRVLPYGGIWAVSKDGEDKVKAIRNSKQQAIDVAVNLALIHKHGIIIHKKDGKIHKTHTYKELKEKHLSAWS